ncbi:hypothetical protein LTT66_12990 [Nocardia gipuzkoensis]|uniref:hypothetical protein n=1 Tax=Nocardia gipuzkoensis TaxID=2749991 RepID=UPI001E50FCE1|nr:hypothetical protein [Nocardia gipuzkoensis]UGT70989.1 hypothetical protein LTT66_12990 [Nocardia gipuzkoensis]
MVPLASGLLGGGVERVASGAAFDGFVWVAEFLGSAVAFGAGSAFGLGTLVAVPEVGMSFPVCGAAFEADSVLAGDPGFSGAVSGDGAESGAFAGVCTEGAAVSAPTGAGFCANSASSRAKSKSGSRRGCSSRTGPASSRVSPVDRGFVASWEASPPA